MQVDVEFLSLAHNNEMLCLHPAKQKKGNTLLVNAPTIVNSGNLKDEH